MNYNDLRHFADSWGLVVMGMIFLILIAWPFRKANRDTSNATTMPPT